ncbi:hypothetical protein FJ693_12200 [Georgenia yuyongxinii]|uniref:DUF4232 domain-containing protein n=1 Tax=Georgenia yuyongxinii TaxID=2589797 RepID=A0A552WQL4_9MICO|nr:hypothetical protein FJ693_12200 [Georgenia yuyongxinii]
MLALVVWGVVAGIGALRGAANAAPVAPSPATSTGPVDPTECAPRDLQVELTPAVGGSGQPVTFAVGMVNEGEVACLVDAGRAALVLTVTSGSDRVWSSGDCAAEPAERRLLLDAGDRAETTLTWSGARSAPGCAGGQGSSGAGTYRVEATMGGALLGGATATFARG